MQLTAVNSQMYSLGGKTKQYQELMNRGLTPDMHSARKRKIPQQEIVLLDYRQPHSQIEPDSTKQHSGEAICNARGILFTCTEQGRAFKMAGNSFIGCWWRDHRTHKRSIRHSSFSIKMGEKREENPHQQLSRCKDDLPDVKLRIFWDFF